MRNVLLVLLTAFFASSATFTQTVVPRPRLVLVLAIDQMRFDYLTRFDPLYRHGLRTLIDRGAVFSEASYRHSANETGPGHSVILSGRHPSHSGIVANEWYDSYLRRAMNVVDDPIQSPIGGAGRRASPANALSFTIGDVLKATSPTSRVVGISLKDRSAILMGGRRADAAYWFENAGGNFITSTYYMRGAPQWLTEWNGRKMADRYFGKTWTRILEDHAVYERYAGKDAVEGEWDRKDIVFPHAIRGKPPQPAFYVDLRRTPFADELTLDLALEAMKAHQIGEDSDTDVFAIGFSGTDVIGHTYGPDSHEIMDQLLRLDLQLGRLFKEIDSRIGLKNTLVVLTADHGSLPLVENLQARGVDARRASPATLERAVAEAFGQRFPGVAKLVDYFATDFYFNEETIRLHNLSRKDVENTAIAALMGTGLVEKVYTHDDLRSTERSSDPFLRLFQNAFFEPRSPHLNVLLKKYVYMSVMLGGTGHGTAYEYDRQVPIVFMGPGIAPGRYREPCGPEDIAPTLALILGLEFPREEDSRLLTEMLSTNPSVAQEPRQIPPVRNPIPPAPVGR